MTRLARGLGRLAYMSGLERNEGYEHCLDFSAELTIGS